MQENSKLIEMIQQRINQFIANRSEELEEIAPDLLSLTNFAAELLSGGKRFRALFCYWGWYAVAADNFDLLAEPEKQLETIVSAAAALEIFQAAALVHDDLIDNSDTRRGRDAAHIHFSKLHKQSSWCQDADAFGRNTALLLGDLLLGWSDELFDEALANLPNETAKDARAEFVRMRHVVTAGQYLDILEEQVWLQHDHETQLERAQRVIIHKSANYSVVSPLRIGATIAGATSEQYLALSDYGLPLGIAYQLRDDLLGVFGDSTVTGKPSGDDLREGKRTVLIALARKFSSASVARFIDELLGDENLTEQQIKILQREITNSGAVAKTEKLITSFVDRARAALDEVNIAKKAAAQLRLLADKVANRDA